MRGIIISLLLSVPLANWALDLESPVFENGEYIPTKYTCEGENISPPLFWKNPPANTKSFVLISDDPDAPFKTWVHWIIYNIPSQEVDLGEGIPKEGVLEKGMLQGINDFGNIGYGGPCPPPGKPHRYFFKLYALDTTLTLKEGATKKEVIKEMQGHILAETKLIGLYKRKAKQ